MKKKKKKKIEDNAKKQVETLKGLKPEAIESKSNNKPLISKEIYDKLFDKRMDEILEMSSEINLNILIFHFKGPSPSICFTEFGGPMYTYNQLQKW